VTSPNTNTPYKQELVSTSVTGRRPSLTLTFLSLPHASPPPIMPKSDSDVTEGGSITSDDEEAIGPSSPVREQHEPTTANLEAPPPTSFGPLPQAPRLFTGASNGGTGGTSRFKNSALRVIQMSKGSSALRPPGAEPGVDVRRASAAAIYGHIHRECSIKIIDYGAVRANFKDNIKNEHLKRHLDEGMPSWAKVRWIKIGGISWDVVRDLGLHYGALLLSYQNLWLFF
jgi:hypothetical protein